jgi:hypothetical protein
MAESVVTLNLEAGYPTVEEVRSRYFGRVAMSIGFKDWSNSYDTIIETIW